MTQVCPDANVPISFLLAPLADRPPSVIVRTAFASRITLAVSETTLDEVTRSVRNKRYLRDRIGVERGHAFITQLRELAVILPELDELPAALVRDPGDNYLLAHLDRDRPNFLVTGDEDLLVLGEHAGVRIVSPAAFVAILDVSAAKPGES